MSSSGRVVSGGGGGGIATVDGDPGPAVDLSDDYEAAGAVATHAGAGDPHPTYTTAAELATAIAAVIDPTELSTALAAVTFDGLADVDAAGRQDGDLFAYDQGTGLMLPVAPSGAEEAAVGYNDDGTAPLVTKTGAGTAWFDVPGTLVSVFPDSRPQWLFALCMGANSTTVGGGSGHCRITETTSGSDVEFARQSAALLNAVGAAVSIPPAMRRLDPADVVGERTFKVQLGITITAAGPISWQAPCTAVQPTFILVMKK